MTHKDFNWKRETWTYDYETDFEKMKKALSESVANHFPDKNLDWVLRVDASDKAVGTVLYQERPGDFGVVHMSRSVSRARSLATSPHVGMLLRRRPIRRITALVT